MHVQLPEGRALHADPFWIPRWDLPLTPEDWFRGFKGPLVLLAWSAGIVEEWTFTIEGAPSVTVNPSRTSGRDAHFLGPHDFASGQVAATIGVATATTVRAHHMAHVDFDAANKLFLRYYTARGIIGIPVSLDELSLHLPSGEITPCRCFATHFAGEGAHPPGPYRALLTGVGNPVTTETIILFWIDWQPPQAIG